MIDVSFETFLKTLTDFPVQQDVISEAITEDRVWFRRSEANTELFLGGQHGLTTTIFDVEVMSLDIDSAQAEGAAIQAGLHGYLGTMGSDLVLLAECHDQEDDYLAKNMGDDTGLHIVAFAAEIIQG